MTFGELFPSQIEDTGKAYNLGTVHSVKGETYDAVLLFLKKRVSKNYTTLLREFSKNLTQPYDEEEMRVVYVGITRPRKLLWVAVPEDDLEEWRAFFS